MTCALPKKFLTFPLSLPMTAAAVGTVATLWCGKRYHVAFGIAWIALSVLHGIQHAGKMKRDAGCLFPRAETPASSSALAMFLRDTEIASFLPGRLRIRHRQLIGNAVLAQQIESYVASFTGVRSAAANLQTGSLLICYDPAILRQKPGLARLASQGCQASQFTKSFS